MSRKRQREWQVWALDLGNTLRFIIGGLTQTEAEATARSVRYAKNVLDAYVRHETEDAPSVTVP